MRAYDFEYDGSNLSDYGFMICSIGSQGLQTLSNGAEITFNTLPVQRGKKHELSSVRYDSCLETVIQICKNPCGVDEMEISIDEQRLLARWLNHEEYRKFKILGDEYLNFYYEAAFNIKCVEFDGRVCALELDVKTNRPFALLEMSRTEIENNIAGEEHIIYDNSDVEGHIYPKMVVEIMEDGDLDIYNDIEKRHTLITECKNGETIEMEYPMISTNDETHKIQDCFNWEFFRVANSRMNNINRITVSLKCKIKIEYSPYAKIGL